MEGITTISELIRSEKFRRRPAMYLGRLSILEFSAFIAGYRTALWIHGIEEENNILNNSEFNDFVAEHYNKPAQAGWAKNIWAESYGEEPHSFMMFFLLFDKFIGEEKGDDFYQNLMLLYSGRLKQEDINFNSISS